MGVKPEAFGWVCKERHQQMLALNIIQKKKKNHNTLFYSFVVLFLNVDSKKYTIVVKQLQLSVLVPYPTWLLPNLSS